MRNIQGEEVCDNASCRAAILPLMFRLSRILSERQDLSEILEVVLQILEQEMGMVRGMVNLYDAARGRIFVHRSLGLSPDEEARGIYSIGEGVTGKVVETGKPIALARIGGSPDFLDRTGSHDEPADENLSFLCVPVARGRKALGTIAAERAYDKPDHIQRDVELLSTIAALIAPAVELYLVENVEKVRLQQENRRLTEALKERFRPTNIIGDSRSMREVFDLLGRIAPTRATVLVLGESGTGKELVAGAIHYASQVASGPYVQFNCAALPESIIESELFGHEKGAFTGAVASRTGRFEEADGGTIFLDEIGELSLPMQAKLLRVLQERTFERVGGNRPVKVDIRIVAATNRDLLSMVAAGTFRGDLFYRLNVFPIQIPPLRERGSDIVALADHFVARFSREAGKAVKRISTPALDMLMAYPWPGNVRELENVIERAVILSDDEVIHGYSLPPSLQSAKLGGTAWRGDLEAKLGAVEYEMLVEALRNNRGNMTMAARELGLTRRMIGIRMGKFGIDHRAFRRRPATDMRLGAA